MDTHTLTLTELERMAATIRCDIIEMIHRAGAGHPGGSLSAADLVTALYFRIMRLDPQNPGWPERDRFILSKGHACPVWYAALARRGYFPLAELATLRQLDSRLQGHPDMLKTVGIDMTAGSLGQGLSAGLGMALGGRVKGLDYHVYVLLGDGEIQEGQVWEAAMAAAKWQLRNLVAILDRNRLQNDGEVDSIMPIDPVADKWRAFGWAVQEIDGHDMRQVVETLEDVRDHARRPTLVLAHTIKGSGVSFMANVAGWHGRAPNAAEAELALCELRGALMPDSNAYPTRYAYAEAVQELAAANPDVVLLNADVARSLRTNEFAQRFPEREFSFGIAEQNMMAAAAGMASVGLIPFVSVYAVFASMRACEQVRTMICYPGLNVKIAASHGGLTAGQDGVTHQGLEDMALMRALAGMTVIMPADAASTRKAVFAAAGQAGPVYLRLTRDAVPALYDDRLDYRIGRAISLRPGCDATIIAIGDMVAPALEAGEALAREGLRIGVLDMHTLKPLDDEAVLRAACDSGAIVTAEDHTLFGGLGSAVAEVLGERRPTPLERVGLGNTYAESGPYRALMAKYGLSAPHIAAAVRRAVGRKRG